MNWELFWKVLGMSISYVLVEGSISEKLGWLTQTQLERRGIIGYSFFEHGGMWSDVFIIPPLVAFIVSRYRLAYFSKPGIAILAVATVLVLAAGQAWRKMSIAMPEVFSHDGRTTVVGWMHLLYAIIAIWICALFYFGLTTPFLRRMDIVVVSALLTPFFYLGVAKWSKQWTFTPAAKWQVAIEVIVLWIITGVRLWRG